ncbi:MAG: PA2169 family four-helix-bundle protein [Acidobacteria bacterium]|nr:PA2169 family four-helix-bundle protein [Acidobacteriota bacterium]
MTNENTITTLNNLIQTCKDGQEGFKQAAEGTNNSKTKTLFYDLVKQRSEFASELQSIVKSLGGDPENTGSIAGSIHRGWMEIKDAVAGNDETAILNECERGEDAAVSAYKKALESDMPAVPANAVRKQYGAIMAAHDQVKALRNQARAAGA